jgi:Ras-related C3 botulinum toxin substrate 1
MSYGDASIFMICFSVVDNSSFEHVIEWWIPEVRRYSPTIPILLCGTKIDLRSDENCVKELHEKGLDCISSEEGVYMAKKKGCVGYVENSAKLKQNLNETFESVVRSCGKVGASSSNEKDKCSIQ